MSENEITLSDKIIEYLDMYPLGVETEDIYEEFREEYDEPQIDEALEKLKTNDRVMNIGGRWRR